jgi:hypothetical protein
MERHLRRRYRWVRRWGFEHVAWVPPFAVRAARRRARGYEALRYRPDLLVLTGNGALFVEIKPLVRPNSATVNAAQFDHQMAAYSPLYYAFVDSERGVFKACSVEHLKARIMDFVEPSPTQTRGSGQAYYRIDLNGLRERILER